MKTPETKTFDVQSIGIAVPAADAFAYIADPANLPKWTNAFRRADRESALLETPGGSVEIRLATEAHAATGTVDWRMSFPDGSVGEARSRVTPDGEGRAIYAFTLMAPPVPLEDLEGALEAQRGILARELAGLKTLLESR